MATAIPLAASLLLQPPFLPPNTNPNLSPPFFLRNPNRKLYRNQLLTLSWFYRSTSKFCPSKASALDSSSSTGAADAQLRTAATLRDLCEGHVPEHVLRRYCSFGSLEGPLHAHISFGIRALDGGNWVCYTNSSAATRSSCALLWFRLFTSRSGSGKTLTYLLLAYSVINTQRSAVQALIVVPTRELGMQVTKVARMLTATPTDIGEEKQKTSTVMALLDGGLLKRHKTWLKADPPAIVVATLASLCQMLEKHVLDLHLMRVLVIDEVDFMFNSSLQVSSLRKLLTSYSSSLSRQTVFASASIPQHRRFLHDCVQQKWTKRNIVHVHVNPVQPMPSCLNHRYVVCQKNQKYRTLLSLLELDLPESAVLFVNEQSEKSKKVGDMPTTTLLIEFLRSSYGEFSSISLIEEGMNFNSRATSLLEVRKRNCYLVVATDLAARGVDLQETTHIYNFDLPKSAVHYLHRAGRAGRKPFSDDKCIVTSIIAPEEKFVLQRFENELKFHCEQLFL